MYICQYTYARVYIYKDRYKCIFEQTDPLREVIMAAAAVAPIKAVKCSYIYIYIYLYTHTYIHILVLVNINVFSWKCTFEQTDPVCSR